MRVRPGMLPAIITVAPNSPTARVKPRIAAATRPRAASGSVNRDEGRDRAMTQRARHRLVARIDAFEGDARGADHQRQRHHRAGRDRAAPGEEEAEIDAERVAPERSARAEEAQQQETDRRRRQHQRQPEQRGEQVAARERAPRHDVGQRDRGRSDHAAIDTDATRRLSSSAATTSWAIMPTVPAAAGQKPWRSKIALRLVAGEEVEELGRALRQRCGRRTSAPT